MKTGDQLLHRFSCRQILDCGDACLSDGRQGVCGVTAFARAALKVWRLATDIAAFTHTRERKDEIPAAAIPNPIPFFFVLSVPFCEENRRTRRKRRNASKEFRPKAATPKTPCLPLDRQASPQSKTLRDRRGRPNSARSWTAPSPLALSDGWGRTTDDTYPQLQVKRTIQNRFMKTTNQPTHPSPLVFGFHPHRTARRHRHHRDPGLAAVARAQQCQGTGEADQVCE